MVPGQLCGQWRAAITLLNCKKLHALGKWYRVTAVWDGKTLKNYVGDELQGEGPLVMKPGGGAHVGWHAAEQGVSVQGRGAGGADDGAGAAGG